MSRDMRWPIRNQILVPVTAILIVAVVSTAVSSAYFAARRSERAIVDQLNRVLETLGRSDFPYSSSVLDKMKGLSGAEFVAFDERDREIARTLKLQAEDRRIEWPEVPLHRIGSASPADFPTVNAAGETYFAFSIRRTNAQRRRERLLVLYPVASLAQARRQAAIPPLVVGGVTLVAMVLISIGMAGRIGRRIRTIQEHVAVIADGDFQEVAVAGRNDEIGDLVESINRMSNRLHEMQNTLRQNERIGLLGQLAGGLAHQLRNAITGARLAVQIHQRRCPSEGDDESLDVALRQLALTEEQVKGLLSLGQPERRNPVPARLEALIDDIRALVSPVCEHAGVALDIEVEESAVCTIADSEIVRTAVLNLVLNAVDAAGSEGAVTLRAETEGSSITWTVSDTGPGPPPEIAETLTELFVTGKQEGVGLGLALVQQAAEKFHGGLEWDRDGGLTRFRLTLNDVICPDSPAEHAVTDRGGLQSEIHNPKSAISP